MEGGSLPCSRCGELWDWLRGSTKIQQLQAGTAADAVAGLPEASPIQAAKHEIFGRCAKRPFSA